MTTENMNILGYSWEQIQAAQQGDKNALSGPIKNENASVQCYRCNKFFRLPQVLAGNPFPIQCSHCGNFHTEQEAKQSFWPIDRVYARVLKGRNL